MELKGDSAYESGLKAAETGSLVTLTPCRYEGENVVVESILDPLDYGKQYAVEGNDWRHTFIASAAREIRKHMPDGCDPID